MSIRRIAALVFLLPALFLTSLFVKESPQHLPHATLFAAWITGVVILPRHFRCISAWAALTAAFWAVGSHLLL